MIQVDEPPDVRACSACNEPLDWILRANDLKWYAIVRYRDNPDPSVVKLHTCPLPGAPRTWRKLAYQPPEVRSRGARRARAVLNAKRNKRRTEGENE